jgi:BASS family bile acid:Na+ symporter
MRRASNLGAGPFRAWRHDEIDVDHFRIAPVALRSLSAVYLICMMFSIGLELGRPSEAVREHHRRSILSGLVVNLVLVPALAVLITRAFNTSSEMAIAVLLLAAAPGGPFVPDIARVAGAEKSVAVELTLLLAKIAAFSAPVTTRLVLSVHNIHVSEWQFLSKLILFQIVPYLLGRTLRRRRETSERLHNPARLAANLSAIALLIMIVLDAGWRAFDLLGDRGWLVALVVAGGALILGWLFGGPEESTRSAVAISATGRNLGLALVIGAEAFPHSNVQFATFASWAVMTGLSYVFARLRARREAASHGATGHGSGTAIS